MQRAESTEDQIRKCKEFARAKGWQVLENHIYFDKAVSGSSVLGRGNFQKMIDVAKTKPKPFDYLLVDDTKRLAREVSTFKKTIDILEFSGIHTYFVSEGIDSSAENSKILLTIFSGIAENDLQYIAQTTHRGLESQFLRGFNAGGKAYGYKTEPIYGDKVDRYGKSIPIGYRKVINPTEAKIIRRIFQEYVRSKSPREITKRLNEQGIPPQRTGRNGTKTWYYKTISGDNQRNTGILNNELYIGRYFWNRTQWKKNPETGKRVSCPRPAEEWQVKDMPELRIISADLWQQVKERQKKLRAISKSGSYQRTKEEYGKYLFSGLLKCKCGGNYVMLNNETGDPYYGCNTHRSKGNKICSNKLQIRESVLMETIIPFFKNRIMAQHLDTLVDKVNKLILDTVGKSDTKEKEIKDRLRTVNRKLENIKQAIIQGILTATTGQMLREVEQSKTTLEAELTSIQSLKAERPPRILKAEVQRYIEGLDQTINKNTRLARTELRKHLGDIELEPFIDSKAKRSLQANITVDPEGFIGTWLKDFYRIKSIAGAGFILYHTFRKKVYRLRLR